MRHWLAVALAGLTVGCTSAEEQARVAKVRIVKAAALVRGCQVLGTVTVTDEDSQGLQKQAARLGGDVALVIRESPGTVKDRIGGRRYVTYTTADVYWWGGAR